MVIVVSNETYKDIDHLKVRVAERFDDNPNVKDTTAKVKDVRIPDIVEDERWAV